MAPWCQISRSLPVSRLRRSLVTCFSLRGVCKPWSPRVFFLAVKSLLCIVRPTNGCSTCNTHVCNWNTSTARKMTPIWFTPTATMSHTEASGTWLFSPPTCTRQAKSSRRAGCPSRRSQVTLIFVRGYVGVLSGPSLDGSQHAFPCPFFATQGPRTNQPRRKLDLEPEGV